MSPKIHCHSSVVMPFKNCTEPSAQALVGQNSTVTVGRDLKEWKERKQCTPNSRSTAQLRLQKLVCGWHRGDANTTEIMWKIIFKWNEPNTITERDLISTKALVPCSLSSLLWCWGTQSGEREKTCREEVSPSRTDPARTSADRQNHGGSEEK